LADIPFSTFVAGLALDTIGGIEKLPVVDGSTPRHVTPNALSAYVIDQIHAAAVITALTDAHQLPVFTSGDDEKIITFSNVSAWMADQLEAITAGVTIISGDTILYVDGGVLKQINIDTILTYINSTNGTLGAQIAALATAVLADTDQYVLVQGGTAKKTTFADIAARAHAQLSTFVAALSAVVTPVDADKLYILQGSTAKYVTLTVLANTYLAAELNLQSLQWPTTTTTPSLAGDKLLMRRASVTSEVDIGTLVTYFGSGLQDAVLDFAALAAAVPNATDRFVVDDAGTPKRLALSALETKLWADFLAYVDALAAVVTVTDSDQFYVIQSGAAKTVTPVQLAAYFDVGTGDVTGPVTTTESNIPQWTATTKDLKDGLTLVTAVREAGSAVDTAVPTEQAVREALATAAFDELDIDGAVPIGEALAGADLFIVDHGANGTNRSCAASRIKTYIETAGTFDNIYVDAGVMVTCVTNGAAAGQAESPTNKVERKYYAFDGGATEERVQFRLVMPEAWDRGDVRARFFWSSAAGSTTGDTVEWGIKAISISDNDLLDVALGAIQNISDTLLADNGTKLQRSAAVEITIGGSPQLSDMLVFEVYRNTDGVDDMTEDAWLFGVELQYQRNREVAAWSPAVSASPSSSPSASVSSSPSASVSSSPSSSPSASSSPSSSPSTSPSASASSSPSASPSTSPSASPSPSSSPSASASSSPSASASSSPSAT
jgi:hypothetical protein